MIAILFFSSFLHAAELWSIGEKQIMLSKCPEKYCLYQCPVEKDCLALKAFKNPVKAKESEGGKNPGSGACSELGGSVSVAQDQDKNQLGLCRFNDGSLLSLDGLWVW